MKTRETTPGKTYSVHSTAGCTVSDDSGWSKELAAPEDYFTAHRGKVYLSDDSASVRELFKSVLCFSGGGNSGGNAGDWYGILKLELDALLGAGNYKLSYQWEGETAVLTCAVPLETTSDVVAQVESLLRRSAPGAVRVELADAPLGFTRLAYIGANKHCFFDTGLTVSSATGARVVALNEDNDSEYYSALAGIKTQFLVAGINPKSNLISWAWSTAPDAPSYTTLLNGQVITATEANSHASQRLKYNGGVFTARLNYMQSGAWDYEEGERFVSGALPSPDALSTSNILLFDRGSSSNYSWRGRIYVAQFTEGVRMVRNFVPVVNTSGVPCMFDTISRTEFFNKSANTLICGVETQDQLNTLLRGLPDRTGMSTGELQVRLASDLQTDANRAALDSMASKNWEISEP